MMLWSDWTAIWYPRLGPLLHLISAWEPGGKGLIDINTETGSIIGVHIAITHYRASRKHLIDNFRETRPFLNAEVGCPNVEVQVRCMTNRGDILWTMPRSSNSINLREDGRISRWRQATYRAYVHSNEIDQPALD